MRILLRHRRGRLPEHAVAMCSLLCAALLSQGCSRGESVGTATAKTQTIHLDNEGDPHDLDPHTETGALERRIISALFEGLLSRDPVTARLVPGVAQHWDISADHKVYTFHLRPEARWSDGTPITAADFVVTFKRMFSSALGCEQRVKYYAIVGARDFAERRIDDFDRVGIKARDQRTLEISLTEPCSHLLDLLSEAESVVLPVAHMAKWGALERRGTAWTRAGNLMGNGPFKLKRWDPQDRITVEKSETYWDASSVRVDEVAFHSTESIDVAERMFRTKALHICRVPPARINAYRRDRPDLLWTSVMPRTSYVVVNVKRATLADARVRRALGLAIDRERLVTVLRNGSVPARACPPPDLDGYRAPDSFRESVNEARQLLVEAGFPGGKGLGPFELLFSPRHNTAGILEALQEMWRVNLGLEVKLMQQEWKVYLDSEKNGQYDLAADGWGAVYPCAYYELFTTAGSDLSWYFWRNEKYDKLYADAARTMDKPARHALYRAMDAILADEMPVIPLYYHGAMMLLQPPVRGYEKNWADVHPVKALWLQDGK